MDPDKPLAGVRVCDFFWLIAGPLTSRFLADLGAEVIKIESSLRMDQIRLTGTWPAGGQAAGPNAVFADCNTGKKSITLNLNDSRGIEVVKRLVAKSDIVTNNFTGGRMDRWGLGYEDLVEVRQDLIMMTMPVMGRTGPYRDYGANGNGVIAFGGLDTNMGFPGRPPVGMGPLYSDFASPFFAISALMAALYHRQRSGEGQFIDLALAQVTASLLGAGVLEYSATGEVPAPPGNGATDFAPHGAYRCFGKDRWLAIAVRSEEEWSALCQVLGREDLLQDSSLQSVAGRRKAEHRVAQAIEEWTSTHDPWQAMHLLQAARVPAGVIEDIEDMVVRDPHLSNQHFQRLRAPDGPEYILHGVPLRLDGEQPDLALPPTLGESSAYVLSDVLALTDAEIAELVSEGVIQ